MKLSLSQKRNRDDAFISLSQSDSDTDENDDSDLLPLSQSILASASPASPRLSDSSPTLQRKRTPNASHKLQKQRPRKSSLSNKVLWVDMFKGSAAILSKPADEEATERLAALEESQEQLA